MTPFTTRFAPSPTGLLHLGHAFSASLAHDAARRAGGRFYVRIEDIDAARRRPEFEAEILSDLTWLGISSDPPIRRQSDHLAEYAAALNALIDRGLVYRCFKTRKEVLDDIAQAPHLPPGGPAGPAFVGAPLSPDEERARLADGVPFGWRLSLSSALATLGPRAAALSIETETLDPPHSRRRVPVDISGLGDVILARKDAGTSYHLASVHDDALQGVTHVIRGEDLAPAAHLHRLLQALMDWPPVIYRHHPLITDDAGRRLAKRDRAATLAALRAAGATPQDVRRRLGLIG